MVPFALSLLVIASLPACWGKQKPKLVPPREKEVVEQVEETKKPKRVSGPLSEKEVGWEEQDYA